VTKEQQSDIWKSEIEQEFKELDQLFLDMKPGSIESERLIKQARSKLKK